MVSCTHDASLGITTTDISQAMPTLTKNDLSSTMTGYYLDPEKKIYALKTLGTKGKNGESITMFSITYRDAPNCGTTIIANDGERKDKLSVEKLITLAQSIRFPHPTPLAKQFTSRYFSLSNIPENVYIGE